MGQRAVGRDGKERSEPSTNATVIDVDRARASPRFPLLRKEDDDARGRSAVSTEEERGVEEAAEKARRERAFFRPFSGEVS